MPPVKSDEAIDTSGMWDRASKVLRDRESAEGDPNLRSQFDTPTPTTSCSTKPNGSPPISPDDSEKSQWSQLSYKVPESTQGDCSKEETTTRSLPVHQTDGPRPPTDPTSQDVQAKDVDKPFTKGEDASPVAPASVTSTPKQNVFPVQLPFSGSPLHFARASLPSPAATNIPSTPAHMPPPSLPSEPPANPQPSGYRPPSRQQQQQPFGDTQYQSYPPRLGLPYDSPMPCQMTPMSYSQGFVAPYIQQMYSDPVWLSGQQVQAVTPQGKTLKRLSDAFVACDPFRPGSDRKVEKLSINTTFDDIQIDDSRSYRVSVSSSGRSGRDSLTLNYPQSSYHPCQTSPLYQASQPPGSYPAVQATTSYQATGPHQPPRSTDPSQHASSGQTPQPTDLYQNPLPTPQSILYRNPFSPAQGHTPQSTSNQFADFVPPRLVNQAQQPSIQEPARPPYPPTNSMPLAHPTPFVEAPPGQASSPHVGIHNQSLDSSTRNRWSLSATTSSWNGPYYDPPMTGALPPRFAQSMEYDTPFVSSSQTTLRPPTVNQIASHQSPQSGLHETIPSDSQGPNTSSTWPEYVLTDSDYELYPSEAQPPPFDLFPVVKPSSLWTRIGNFCRRFVVWIRGGKNLAGSDGDGGGHYYSTNTFTYYATTEGYGKVAGKFVLETLPRTLYIYLLLRLPALYFGRVARIFEEADLTLSEIKKMAIETAAAAHGQLDLQMAAVAAAADVSMVHPQYERLASTWQTFVNDVMREWQTFNIVSVLLLSAILSILSNADVAQDPVSRYFALSALICALISLLFGCMYTVQFGCMRKAYKAAEWALEAKKSQRFIFWNVWVLLALPVVWLSWSILMFFMCIMAFLWRASPVRRSPPPVLSDGGLLAVRLVLTFVIALAISYGILVLATFSRYGDTMDKAWKRRINSWLKERTGPAARVPTPTYNNNNNPGPGSNPAAQQRSCQPQQESTTIASSGYDGGPASAAAAAWPQGSTAPRFVLQRLPSDVSDGYGDTKSSQDTHFDYNTQHNTMLNRNSAQYTSGDGENPPGTDSAPPTPPSKSSSLRARLATTPTSSNPAISRQMVLPPIPGTPVTTTTTVVDRNSTLSLVDSGPAGNKDDDDDDKRKSGSPHVHFRSPVASARECSPISSNHSSHGPFGTKGFDQHHRYPPMPPGGFSGLNIYQAGSDESFDPYKHHLPFGHPG